MINLMYSVDKDYNTIYIWKHIWITISLIVIIFLPIASYFLVKNLNFESRETQEDENSSEDKSDLSSLKDLAEDGEVEDGGVTDKDIPF